MGGDIKIKLCAISYRARTNYKYCVLVSLLVNTFKIIQIAVSPSFSKAQTLLLGTWVVICGIHLFDSKFERVIYFKISLPIIPFITI